MANKLSSASRGMAAHEHSSGKAVGKAMPEKAPMNSVMKGGHKLQHAEYNGDCGVGCGFKK